MKLIFRNYKDGDDKQIVDLFNIAFQTVGGGFLRTPKSWNWRYIQAPSFEPKQFQIAEDTENNMIVGAVMVNLVENISINGKNYLTGQINDVSCHPDYTGQGIAKKLMNMAISYMKEKECDLSILSADYHGFPRKKIYLKLGYEDVEKNCQVFQVANVFNLIRNMPAATILFPFLFVVSYVPRFLNRIRIKMNPFFKDISYEIAYNKKHFEYMNAANKIMPQNYDGVTSYDKEKIFWNRINTPSERFKPTYVIIHKKNRIIGGAAFTFQNVYAIKFGIKIRITITHELFLDKQVFNNRRDLHFGYIYLIDKLLKAATQRSISALFFQAPRKAIDLLKGFRGMNLFMLTSGVTMIKSMKDSLEIPKPLKPLFTPTYVSTLY